MRLRDLWALLKESWNAWSTDKATRLGAALAYYTTFSLAPLLVIVIAIAALVFGREAVQGKIVAEIGGLMGTESASAIQTMIEKARTPATGIFATIAAIPGSPRTLVTTPKSQLAFRKPTCDNPLLTETI